MYHLQHDTNEIILAWFLFCAVIQLAYWLLVSVRFALHRPAPAYHRKFPVSVIICARDQAENLRKNLPLILEQDYPGFEVVVVNDRSRDGTEELLERLQGKYPNLRKTAIKESGSHIWGKKLALTVGIKAARYEWLLLTDADCRPVSARWLWTMQRNFDREASVVLGYGGYERRKGLLNRMIRYESVIIALQYFSLALAGIPYMGVGRNLAYRKSVFFGNRGFASHAGLSSGDDDLFVHEVAGRRNTRVEFRPQAHTRSVPETSWREWYYRKRRHLLTAPRYRAGIKLLLSAESVSRIFYYAGFVFLIITKQWPVLGVSIFSGRLLMQLLVLYYTGRRLNEKQLLLFSPLFDLAIPFINALLLFMNFVAFKRSRWK